MNRQRGALTFIVPLIMVIIVLFGTLAIDGARLYSLRQDMQSQVNAAATAAAGAAKACSGPEVELSEIRRRALVAAREQGFDGDDADLVVEPGVMYGNEEDGTVSFKKEAQLEKTNAVFVQYEKDVPISLLLPAETFGSIPISVNAAVRKEVIATISASGGTLLVDSGILGGLLGAVLGQPGYTLDPTSLSSLRNTTVLLGDLLNELGVNRVEDLLPIGGAELARALSAVGGGASGLGRLLDDLASASGIETIKVADILKVVENTSVPANSEFPLYDVVISLTLNLLEELQESNSDGLVYLPLDVNLGLPGVAEVSATVGLHVGEPSSLAIGPATRDDDGAWATQFYAPDVSLLVAASVNVLSLPGTSVGVADIDLPLAVEVGGGKGALVSAECAEGIENDVLFGVEIEREVARVASGRINKSTGQVISEPVKIGLLGLFPLLPKLIEVSAVVDGTVPGGNEEVLLEPGYPLYCSEGEGCAKVSYQDSGAGPSGLDLSVDLDDTKLLGLELGWLLNPLVNGLTDLLDDVLGLLVSGLVNPLLSTLGVGLGSMSVTVTGANQDHIQLVEGVVLEEQGP